MNQLTGIIWNWEKTQYSDDTTITATDPKRYLVEFLADGGLAIKADCNQVRGSYQTQGNNLTIQLGPSTLVACPPDSQADQFLKGLAEVGSYMFADGRLVLLLKLDAGSMTLAGSSPTALAGTSWSVTGINNGKQAVVSVIIGTTVTLNFGADGQVTGLAGCNNYFGPYGTSGEQIKIGPLGATRKMCVRPEGIMEQEANLFTALQNAATVRIIGDRLEIRNAGGALQVGATR